MAGIELYAPRLARHRRTWSVAAVVLAAVFLIAGPLMKVMGDQIAGAITRIFGVILCALAVQMIIVGIIGAFGLQIAAG